MLPRGSTLVSTLLLQSGTYYLCGHPYPADPVGHLFESYSYYMDTLTLRTQQDILDCGSPPCVTAWALQGDCPTGAMGRTPMGYPGLIAPSVPLPRVPSCHSYLLDGLTEHILTAHTATLPRLCTEIS